VRLPLALPLGRSSQLNQKAQAKLREYVILALYCSSVRCSAPARDDFIATLDFIKPWVVKLAGGEGSRADRLIGKQLPVVTLHGGVTIVFTGYMACKELLQRGDGLALMLVNTLRRVSI
jgi:hypothetical protein